MQLPAGYLASAIALASVVTLSGCGGGSDGGGGGGGGSADSSTTLRPLIPSVDPAGPTDSPAEPTDSPAEPTDSPAEPTDSPAEPTTTEPAGCVPVVLPHTGTLSEEARTVDELNELFLAFDESDPASGNGVTIRMTDDFTLWCGTGCNNGYADCRVSASVYNHRVMIRHDTNNIAVTMGRDAGIIFNQTAVETMFGKCSYMYDGATFARVNRGCGCSSKTNFCGNHASAWNNEDCDWNGTPREWNAPVEGSCHPNTATSPDVAECACSAPNPREPMPQRTTDIQCFWQGAAINGTTGTVPSELRQMLLSRIENQVGTEDVGEPTIRYKQEYWNEIVLDAEVMLDALHADPRSAVAAFVYIRGHGAGRDKANRMSQKAAQDYGGSPIPVIELNPWVDGACNGPFRVPGEDVTTVVV